MKSTELKLGNLVYYYGVIGKVYSIIGKEPREDHHFADKEIITMWNNGLSDVIIDNIEPIPLTEEWLVKFGFVQELSWLGPSDEFTKGLITFGKIGGDHSLYQLQYNGRYTMCRIEYVHQLQNLYFALTGKELTLEV